MARLSDLTVLVTGARTPLGVATIGRLVAEGARVVAADRDGADDVAARFGGRVEALQIDVTDPHSWERAAAGIRAGAFGLHGVVNNASAVRTGPLISMDPADVATMINVNMLGPALAIRTMAPLLAASGGGSIVNIASTEALRGALHAAVFSATNWGLRGLTRSAALELGGQGIRVNTVCPSTGLMHSAAATPGTALVDQGRARVVTMGDIAAMVAFLLSDDSATCTGGDFLVDAGSSAGEPIA